MPGSFYSDDLQQLFSPDELGTAALITTGQRAGSFVNGIYSAPYSGSFGAHSTLPQFVVRLADILDVRPKDHIEIDITLFRIDSIEPGDADTARLSLAIVSP